MKIMITTLLASFLMAGTIVTTAPSEATAGVEKYTCDFSVDGGTIVVAEVGVKITGNGNTVVTVDYFSEDYAEYLGKYQERNGEVVPSTADEACQFAEDHFEDRE